MAAEHSKLEAISAAVYCTRWFDSHHAFLSIQIQQCVTAPLWLAQNWKDWPGSFVTSSAH